VIDCGRIGMLILIFFLQFFNKTKQCDHGFIKCGRNVAFSVQEDSFGMNPIE
jgi:hypothetical protein